MYVRMHVLLNLCSFQQPSLYWTCTETTGPNWIMRWNDSLLTQNGVWDVHMCVCVCVCVFVLTVGCNCFAGVQGPCGPSASSLHSISKPWVYEASKACSWDPGDISDWACRGNSLSSPHVAKLACRPSAVESHLSMSVSSYFMFLQHNFHFSLF